MVRKGDGLVLKGKSWFLEARINGVRYQKKLGRGISRSVAAELAQVLRGSILKNEAGIGGRKKKDLSFTEARQKFEDWMASDRKANTIRSYAACLRVLAKTFGSMRLSEITTWQLESYRQKRSAGVKLTERPDNLTDLDWARRCRQALAGAPVRVSRELAVMKCLFNKCISWGVFEGLNPATKIKFRREPRQRLRFLEAEETDRLLSACSEPLKTLVLVGINCGLRIQAEALQLRWEDIDLGRKMLTVQSAFAKNGKTRTIPMNQPVREALERLKPTTPTGFVFSRTDGQPFKSVKTIFSTACRRAKITHCTLHTLRHTFASRLVMSGADIRTVQELGGWQTIGMVERYAHLSQSHKIQAIEKIGVEFTCGLPCRENSTLTVAS